MRKSSHLTDKAFVIAGLAGVIACAWAYLVPASLDMYGHMDGAAAWMMEATWDGRYLLLVFLMWAAMMVAMMLPSALPTILIFHRARPERSAGPLASPARVGICGRIRDGVVRIRRRGYAAAVGARRGSAVVAHDGERQPVAERRNPRSWRASASGRRSSVLACGIADRRWRSSPSTGGPACPARCASGCIMASIALAAAGR